MSALVVGVGEPTAGDDGVGIFVARSLVARRIEAIESTDPTCLVALLADGRDLIIVDAVLGGGRPGDVLHLSPNALSSLRAPVSSHGIGVAEALTLARVLHQVDVHAVVALVGIVIERAPRTGTGLSPAIAAAIAPAAALAERLAGT